MTRDELEFSISQYVDGTLPTAETAALRQRLETDADARALLDEYQKLEKILKSPSDLPEIQWDQMAARISQAIDEADDRGESYPMPWVKWSTQLAIAACLLIGVGVGIRMYLSRDSKRPMTGNPRVAVLQVNGPEIERVAAAPVAEISVGPATGQAPVMRYADGVVSRPSRIIIASGLESPDPENGFY